MTPQPRDAAVAPSVAALIETSVVPFNPLADVDTQADMPAPANDLDNTRRGNVLEKRRRRRARLAARRS